MKPISYVGNNAYECPKVLLNVDKNAKIVIEFDLCANVRFFALMNVSSHYSSPFSFDAWCGPVLQSVTINQANH